MPGPRPPPNLLLCFDAFGTLFKPKRPVTEQYAEIARQCGVTGFDDGDVQASFKAAFKDEAKRNPNYGKATGLGATRWWTNVITKTFTPLIKTNQGLPPDLAPKLLHRFASSEGYHPAPHIVSSLRSLKSPSPHTTAHRRLSNIIVGVITNSDDRVPSILSSIGLSVSPLRYGSDLAQDKAAQDATRTSQVYDVDFHCISYDVGVEKPERGIFTAAEGMLAHLIAAREGKTTAETGVEVKTWRKVYVGDEYAKDVVGATNAGWNAALLLEDNDSHDLARLEDVKAETVADLFEEREAIGIESIRELTDWLTGGEFGEE